MAICLCDISAQWLWRRFEARSTSQVFGHTLGTGPTLPAAFPARSLDSVESLSDFTGRPDYEATQELSSLGYGLGDPLHLLVSRGRKSDASRSVVAHTLVGDPPKGSLLRYGKSLYVSSPELTLLALGGDVDFIDHLLFAYEFCGCYSVRPDLPDGLLMRHPLTSVAELERFVDSAEGMTGVKSLRHILPYLMCGSGSPRETALALLICLPKRYGGFGLPFPVLNLSLDLGSSASKLWSRGNAFDLVWNDAKVILEYDGGSAHSTDDQRDRDQRRREAASSAGYSVFVLNKRRLENVADTYAVVEKVAQRLGFRLRFDSGFRERHLGLRKRVL